MLAEGGGGMTEENKVDGEMRAIINQIETVLIDSPFSWETYKKVNILTIKWWVKAIKKALPKMGKG